MVTNCSRARTPAGQAGWRRERFPRAKGLVSPANGAARASLAAGERGSAVLSLSPPWWRAVTTTFSKAFVTNSSPPASQSLSLSSPWPENSSPSSTLSCETNAHGSRSPLDRKDSRSHRPSGGPPSPLRGRENSPLASCLLRISTNAKEIACSTSKPSKPRTAPRRCCSTSAFPSAKAKWSRSLAATAWARRRRSRPSWA